MGLFVGHWLILRLITRELIRWRRGSITSLPPHTIRDWCEAITILKQGVPQSREFSYCWSSFRDFQFPSIWHRPERSA